MFILMDKKIMNHNFTLKKLLINKPYDSSKELHCFHTFFKILYHFLKSLFFIHTMNEENEQLDWLEMQCNVSQAATQKIDKQKS